VPSGLALQHKSIN